MKVWNVMNELKHVALIVKHHRGPQYLECKLKTKKKEQQIRSQIRNFHVRMFFDLKMKNTVSILCTVTQTYFSWYRK
jgi:hypothetical protein